MLNNVVLIGRLTRDPESKTVGDNIAISRFTLAVDRAYKDADGNKQADFIPIVTWRKTAELCAQYLKKGSLVAVVGPLQIREYEHEGQKRKDAAVVADRVKFLPTGSGKPQEDGPVFTDEDAIVVADIPF